MEIKIDDITGPEVVGLLKEHLQNMADITPSESIHALDIEELQKPDVTFWSVWEGSELIGCGALKELDPRHGEIKSMRTATSHLRKGVASLLLEYIMDEARQRCYRRISLETGATDAFKSARSLYTKFGFTYCEPFAEYVPDSNSVYMTIEL